MAEPHIRPGRHLAGEDWRPGLKVCSPVGSQQQQLGRGTAAWPQIREGTQLGSEEQAARGWVAQRRRARERRRERLDREDRET